jgi:hypothetical protein
MAVDFTHGLAIRGDMRSWGVQLAEVALEK